MKEALKPFGQLTIVKLDGLTGKTFTQVVPNLIVTTGKYYIAGRLLQAPQAVMTCMGIGTSATAPVVGDTHITEILSTQYAGGVRPTFNVGANPSKANNVLTYTAVFAPAAGAATAVIREAGIFDNTAVPVNPALSGTMLCRTTFGDVTKTSLDTITITWTITIN